MTTLHDDALMVYDGQVVTLRDYRELMSYERHITLWQHLTLTIWRWGERRTYAARKREAARLMKRAGIRPASFGPPATNSSQSGSSPHGVRERGLTNTDVPYGPAAGFIESAGFESPEGVEEANET